MTNLAKFDYIKRVNKAIDHIQTNLDRSLKLDDVARVAHFSPFHFHRIFKALTGDTLNAFVKRVRLERALFLLCHHDAPSLTEVALACGFSSGSDFSRSFRNHFGVPPSAFDLDHHRESRRGQMQDRLTSPETCHLLERLPPGENPDQFEAKIVKKPGRRVAYLRVWKPFENGRVTTAAERLVDWAKANNLESSQWLGYMWEDPDIVDLDQCRYDVAVEVPKDFGLTYNGDAQPDVEGERIGFLDFPPMVLAEVAIDGSIDLEQRALDWLFGTWLPRSGYVPDDQPTFEAWNGLPFEHGNDYFKLSVQLPVV